MCLLLQILRQMTFFVVKLKIPTNVVYAVQWSGRSVWGWPSLITVLWSLLVSSLIFNGTYFGKLLSSCLTVTHEKLVNCRLYKWLVLMGLTWETWEVGWNFMGQESQRWKELTLERLHEPGRHFVTVILDCQITRGDSDLLTHPVSRSSSVPAIG